MFVTLLQKEAEESHQNSLRASMCKNKMPPPQSPIRNLLPLWGKIALRQMNWMPPVLVSSVVNWIQSGVTWGESFSEGWSGAEWPVSISVGLS